MSARNMYGCLPCPRCGSAYRFPLVKDGHKLVVCDDCGRRVPGEWDDESCYPVDEVTILLDAAKGEGGGT